MKKILSLMLSAILLFSCSAVNASMARPFMQDCKDCAEYRTDDELSLYPSSMVLPMFSSSSGEKLRVFASGEMIPPELFIWSSSDPGVVEVTQDGALKAIAPGTAVISISDGYDHAESQITVVDSESFTTIRDLTPTELSLPFYSDQVGIGPLCGAEPVILKRFIKPPSCGGGEEPDPNAYIASEGWTYTYAVFYKFHVSNGQTICFDTSASNGPGAHAANAYVIVYDPYFNIWDYSKGNYNDPYGDLTITFYEDGDFYLAITPITHTDDSNSGNICLYAYDITQPYSLGDVDNDHFVTSTDALIVLRAAMGLAELSDDRAALADFNGSGSVGSDDALSILRLVMGLGADEPYHTVR